MSVSSSAVSSSSSDQTTKPNQVKDVDVESRQGKVAKTDGLMMNDCDTVTTTAISDKKKCQTSLLSVSLLSSEEADEPNVVKEGERRKVGKGRYQRIAALWLQRRLAIAKNARQR